ncbi:AP2-associated protein kinase 1 [Bienertia sinuspersici]
MHYIKKCHMKILKKRKGGQLKASGSAPLTVENLSIPKLPATIPCKPELLIKKMRLLRLRMSTLIIYMYLANALTTVPNDSDLYQAKRQEALRKFEILVELEKQLSTVVPNQNAAEES